MVMLLTGFTLILGDYVYRNVLGRPAQIQPIAKNLQSNLAESDDLHAIANAYVQLEGPNQAASLLSLVLHSAQSIQNDWTKSLALSAVADGAAGLKDPSQSAELLSHVLQSAQSIHAEGYKLDVLRAIANAHAEMNDPSQSAYVFEQALQQYNQAIQNDTANLLALVNLANVYVENDPGRAIELLDQALPSAQAIQLVNIANTYAELNDPERAAELLQQALKSVPTLHEHRFSWNAKRPKIVSSGFVLQTHYRFSSFRRSCQPEIEWRDLDEK